MGWIWFILGIVIGVLAYIYAQKLISILEINWKEYEVKFTIMYFHHPTETSKNGEYIRMKPVTIRLHANNEEDAAEYASDIVHENLKVEIDSVEEVLPK